MEEQVQALCEQLVRAVTIIMEPGSTHEHRLEALRFCDDFKETSPMCVPCGLHLAEKTQPPVIRHFGLQVLEHVVKFRWNAMEQEEKVCLRDSVMGLIAGSIRPILEEGGHIKGVLARIVVEIIKWEWPQHWPNMMNELDTLTKNGEVQKELVMFILLRLAEDVVTFQTLPTHRRRYIQTTMTQNMDKLFTFMVGILANSVHHYRKLKRDPTQKDKCQGLCRVALATLNTLAGYIDWMSFSYLTTLDCKFLQMLCLLLAEEDLQVEAAECLLIAVSRKGKLKDRAPLLNLFADSPIHCIITAAQKAHGEGLQEKRYVFLKRLCQVVSALGSLLCALMPSPENMIEIPMTFDKYLKFLLDFTAHPSQFLKSIAITTWVCLFRHDILSKDHALKAIVPEFLRVSMSNAARVGFPSKNDSPSCEYSRLDFGSDEDFVTFFNYYKSKVGNVIRLACNLNPHASFNMAAEWLQFQLSAPLDPGPNSSKAGEGLCTLLSPSYTQWETMTFICDLVIHQFVRGLQKEDLPVSQGVELLQIVLSYETKDPLILSCLLTILSALFPFVRYMNSLIPSILTKLFSAVTFQPNNKDPQTRSVQCFRFHHLACTSIIKICHFTPELVLPHFDLLSSQAMLLMRDKRVPQVEKYSMLEAQVMISNYFNSYEKQQDFLAQLLSQATSVWSSHEMQRAVSSPDEFISYVGAEILKGLEEGESPCQTNRSQLNLCLYTVKGVLQNAKWPSDLEAAKAGGFVVGFTSDGNPIYRNPCSEQVLKLLDSIFSLVRAFNNLYLPEVVQKMGESYAKCLDILETEKKCILGLIQPVMDTYDVPVYRSAEKRMQAFFRSMYDSCWQILGKLGPAMLQDFYSIPDLATRLLNSAFCNLSNVPDYRLRAMLHMFMKPFILSCPPERYESLLCPIMGPLLTFMNQRLSQKWLTSREGYGEVNTESSEMLEIELARLLTREMVNLLASCCVAQKTSEQSTNNKAEVDGLRGVNQAEAEGSLADEEMMSLEVPLPGSLKLTELGMFLMSSEEVSSPLLISAFSPLVWMDTLACRRAANHLCWPLLKQVISGSLPSEAALCFFTNILHGLQIHGQDEACNHSLVNLALKVYEALRPLFPELRLVMEQVPEVQLDSLQQFDTELLSPGQKTSKKMRKDQFCQLISGCIGKPLGEQFRKDIHIRNLPSLFQKKPRPDLEDSILGGCPEALPELFQQ
ncbi:exportin-5-like [Aquarana catesbeiana]|uniref:exportin-5-like n=1 Tax=Aquarana catesbeiana TaxID=8400 RepID=UPI003CCA4848